MALLCGSLAWMENYKKLASEEASENLKYTPDTPSASERGKSGSQNIATQSFEIVNEKIKFEDDPDFLENQIMKKLAETKKRLMQEENILNSTPESEEFYHGKPKIYFCSRTHKQISQAIDQLKQTQYRPKMAILASRNSYCVNPKVMNQADKNQAW